MRIVGERVIIRGTMPIVGFLIPKVGRWMKERWNCIEYSESDKDGLATWGYLYCVRDAIKVQ